MGYNNGYDEGVPPTADIVQLLRHAPRRVHDQELPRRKSREAWRNL